MIFYYYYYHLGNHEFPKPQSLNVLVGKEPNFQESVKVLTLSYPKCAGQSPGTYFAYLREALHVKVASFLPQTVNVSGLPLWEKVDPWGFESAVQLSSLVTDA